MEEAAAVAAEYIASLDNLPSEVQHLLTEIRHKEMRSQETLQEIQKESAKYIRHSLRNGTAPMSTKDDQIPQRVREAYSEVDRLSEEKIRLSQRLVDLIARARARLDYDLSKVLVLQGDLDPSQQGSFVSTTRNPVQQINESLRSAIAIPDALPVTPVATTPTPSAPPPQKRRRITAMVSNAAIKLPSPAPVIPSQRARLVTQSHRPSPIPRSRRVVSSVGPDEDAEGEDDLDEVGGDDDDNEDKSLYCFCQKMSYGEMIACDNTDCQFQWFHLPCVNLKPPLPEVFYCSDCIGKGFSSNYAAGGNERARKRKR